MVEPMVELTEAPMVEPMVELTEALMEATAALTAATVAQIKVLRSLEALPLRFPSAQRQAARLASNTGTRTSLQTSSGSASTRQSISMETYVSLQTRAGAASMTAAMSRSQLQEVDAIKGTAMLADPSRSLSLTDPSASADADVVEEVRVSAIKAAVQLDVLTRGLRLIDTGGDATVLCADAKHELAIA